MTELMFWQVFWFVVIGAALFLFLWLDGFDLGIGMTLPFLKDPSHRRAVLNVIWPVWDGNELYGLIGGGAIFATFPTIFATLLSGLYPWVVLLIIGIMLRPVAFEAWNHEPKNKKVWEWLFAVCSFLIPFVAGVALGTTIAGMPINQDRMWDHSHGFWEALSPLSVLTGLSVVALALLQGSAYVVKKTSGPLADAARASLGPRAAFAAVALVLTLVAAVLTLPDLWTRPAAIAGIAVGLLLILGGLVGVWLHRRQSPDAAPFWFSSLVVAGTLVLIGGVQFPVMIRSTIDPALSLTIFADGVSNPVESLRLIGIIATAALAVTAVYSVLVYRIFKGKVDHKSNAHY